MFQGNLPFPPYIGATLMAILAMTSLIVGTLIAIYAKPSQRTNAVIMAFGTGALIQALALELAYGGAMLLIQSAKLSGLMSWIWVSSGFIAGGVIYHMVNQALEKRGAALRHPAMAKLYMLNKKKAQSEIILGRLSKVELVRSLPPEEMEDLLVCVQPVRVKQGEIIFRHGEKGDALYLIEEGKVSIISGNGSDPLNGEVLAHLGPGQSFGEMSLLSGAPRSASAVAEQDTSMLKIEKEHFDELIDRSPNLRHAVEELNSQRVVRNVESTKGGVDASHWQKVALANIQRLTRSEEVTMMKKQAATTAPLAVFLGTLLDTIPESVVIGSSFRSFQSFRLTFLAAVFISSIPEAIASVMGMQQAGFKTLKIFGLWMALIVAGAIAAALGNIFLATAPATILTLVGAVAGGGILAMVSSVMMPEAYEDGGASVGLATIAGFLCAFLFSLM